jgi:hypothetical protein
MANEISGQSTGVLDLLLKKPVSDNSLLRVKY